jgi:hypothetical protein
MLRDDADDADVANSTLLPPQLSVRASTARTSPRLV